MQQQNAKSLKYRKMQQSKFELPVRATGSTRKMCVDWTQKLSAAGHHQSVTVALSLVCIVNATVQHKRKLNVSDEVIYKY